MKRRTLTILAALTMPLWGFLFTACEDSTSTPPVISDYTLNLFLYRSPQEILVDSSAFLGCYLTKVGGETLSGERVYLSVTPSTAGRFSPRDYDFTDKTKPNGFSEAVRFIGSQPDTAALRAVYRDLNDREAAADTVHIIVKPPDNW